MNNPMTRRRFFCALACAAAAAGVTIPIGWPGKFTRTYYGIIHPSFLVIPGMKPRTIMRYFLPYPPPDWSEW